MNLRFFCTINVNQKPQVNKLIRWSSWIPQIMFSTYQKGSFKCEREIFSALNLQKISFYLWRYIWLVLPYIERFVASMSKVSLKTSHITTLTSACSSIPNVIFCTRHGLSDFYTGAYIYRYFTFILITCSPIDFIFTFTKPMLC